MGIATVPQTAPDHPRPWIEHYPPGITWDAQLKIVPVHQQVLAACEKDPHGVALDFLGGKTTFGQLKASIAAFAGALQREFGVKKGTRVALLLPYIANFDAFPLRIVESSIFPGSIIPGEEFCSAQVNKISVLSRCCYGYGYKP